MSRGAGVRWGLLLLGAACASAAPPRAVDDPAADPLAVPPGRIHVLVFTTVDCPIANATAPQLAALAESWRSAPVTIFLVHVDPDVTADAAAAHAADHGLAGLTILLDPEHRLTRRVGATRTPEAAVLTAQGLQYLGRIDDRWRGLGQDSQTAEHEDLRAAVADLCAGRPVAVPRTTAVGCLLPEPRQ